MHPLQSTNGMYLVEFTIYGFIISCIITLLLVQTISTCIRLSGEIKNIQKITYAHSVMQLFITDIKKAPGPESQWINISDKQIIWKVNTEYIGWYFKDNKLVVKKGNYDPKKKLWHKHSSSLAIQDVVQGIFTVSYNEQWIISVQMTCDIKLLDQSTYNITVAESPFNRKIV